MAGSSRTLRVAVALVIATGLLTLAPALTGPAVPTALVGANAVAPTHCVVVNDARGKRLYLGNPTSQQRAAADELERWALRHSDQVAGSDWCSTQTALQVWVMPGALLANDIDDLAERWGVPIAITPATRSAQDLRSGLATAVAKVNETGLGIHRMAVNPGAGGVDVELRLGSDQSVLTRVAQIAAAVPVPVFIHLVADPSSSTPSLPADPGEAPTEPEPDGCPSIRDQDGRPWYPAAIPQPVVDLGRALGEVARTHPVEVVTVAPCSTVTGVRVWLTQRAGAQVRAAVQAVAERHPGLEVVVSVADSTGSAEQLWPREPTPLTMVGLVGFERDPTRLVAVAWLDRDSPELLSQATALVTGWNRSVPLEVRAVRLTGGPVIRAVPAPDPTPGDPVRVEPVDLDPQNVAAPRPRPPTWLVALLVALGWLGMMRLAGLGDRVTPTTEVEASEELNALETWRSGFEDFDPD